MIAYSRAMGESWGIMECKDGSRRCNCFGYGFVADRERKVKGRMIK
jgi:hypothetical protein